MGLAGLSSFSFAPNQHASATCPTRQLHTSTGPTWRHSPNVRPHRSAAAAHSIPHSDLVHLHSVHVSTPPRPSPPPHLLPQKPWRLPPPRNQTSSRARTLAHGLAVPAAAAHLGTVLPHLLPPRLRRGALPLRAPPPPPRPPPPAAPRSGGRQGAFRRPSAAARAYGRGAEAAPRRDTDPRPPAPGLPPAPARAHAPPRAVAAAMARRRGRRSRARDDRPAPRLRGHVPPLSSPAPDAVPQERRRRRGRSQEPPVDSRVRQRNAALDHIEHHRLHGVIYFADESNVYSLDLFHHLRQIRSFGTWPVAMLAMGKSKTVLEGPVCNGSRVVGWHTNEKNRRIRRFHVDMSGFAFNSSMLWDAKKRAHQAWNYIRQLDTVKEGFQETTFIEQLVEDENHMEGIPPGCSKIINFHLHLEDRDLVYPKGWQITQNLDVVSPLNQEVKHTV